MSCDARSSPWDTARASCWKCPTARRCSTTPARSARPSLPRNRSPAILWHRGITRIDGMILSHADVDHYNAVPGLLERFRRWRGVRVADDVRLVWRNRSGERAGSIAAGDRRGGRADRERSGRAIGCASGDVTLDSAPSAAATVWSAATTRTASRCLWNMRGGGCCCRAIWNRRGWRT